MKNILDSILNWFDDKQFVIFCILVFGILSLAMRIEGSLSLIEKMAYGLLGMAVGKGIK